VRVEGARVEGATCLLRTAGHARVKKIREHFFCICSTPLTEPVRFGWGFFCFRFLKSKPNRTELFFFKSIGLIDFSVFLLTIIVYECMRYTDKLYYYLSAKVFFWYYCLFVFLYTCFL